MNNDTWNQVMALKPADKRHRPRPDEVANDLTTDEITTIIATADFFMASDNDMRQIWFDLYVVRYRVFDWLAMCVMGRIGSKQAVQVFVHSFIKSRGDVDRFIADLRETDYDIDHTWEEVELDESTHS